MPAKGPNRRGSKGIASSPHQPPAISQVKQRRPARKYRLVVIRSLAPQPFDLLEEMPIIVREIGTETDNFVARFPDAGISASGDTSAEAVENLKDILVAKFLHFSELPISKLGTEPTRQLATLKQFIARRP